MAERDGDEYVVNGSKKWITNGIFADYCTAAVRTEGPGSKGVSALIIPLKAKGVTCRKIDNSGVLASGAAFLQSFFCFSCSFPFRRLIYWGKPGSTYIEFDDVRVPAANLLGQENRGFEIIMSSTSSISAGFLLWRRKKKKWTKKENKKIQISDKGHHIHSDFNHERLWLACTSLRLARVCAEDAYNHATTRETFGKPLIANQLIRSKISSFGRSIDATHAWMEQLVYMASEQAKRLSSGDRGGDLGGLIANLKVLAARTLEHVNREAQQIMGGLGYSKNGRGARVEQISRDVRVLVVGGGSEEILADLAVKQEIKAMAAIWARESKL